MVSTLDFFALTEDINQKLIELQSAPKEQVSDDDAVKALAYIEHLDISQVEQCLLFCASVNLCNTYVKQSNRKIGYAFKQKIPRLIQSVAEKDISGIHFDLQNDGRMSLLVVQIGKIQFSFHEINRDEIEVLLAGHDCLKTSLEWDGIRKQMCAVSTFRLSEQNVQPLLTTTGEGMADCIDSIFRDLEAGRISLRDIITVTSSSCKSTSAKIDYNKAKTYRKEREGMLRPNQWEDLIVRVYI